MYHSVCTCIHSDARLQPVRPTMPRGIPVYAFTPCTIHSLPPKSYLYSMSRISIMIRKWLRGPPRWLLIGRLACAIICGKIDCGGVGRANGTRYFMCGLCVVLSGKIDHRRVRRHNGISIRIGGGYAMVCETRCSLTGLLPLTLCKVSTDPI